MQRYNFVVSWAIPKSDASLFLVQFYRQSVGVAEEHKLLAGIFVRADRFVLYALAVELGFDAAQMAAARDTFSFYTSVPAKWK